MKQFVNTTLATVLLLSPLSAVAQQPLVLEYKSFYSHVNKLDDEDMSALQFAFGFKHIQTSDLCNIDRAFIQTDKQDIPLQITAEQRFTVPKEKALKLANALVIIDVNEPTNVCDMSVQLETKPEWLKSTYTGSELLTIYQQYETFFDDMGGLMSFMMPDATGLMFHFDLSLSGRKTVLGHIDEAGRLSVNKDLLGDTSDVTFPAKPFRITAVTEK